jgi:hypothetical protein
MEKFLGSVVLNGNQCMNGGGGGGLNLPSSIGVCSN